MPSPRPVRPVGRSAFLIECADLDDARALALWVTAEDAPEVCDVLAAMCTLLLVAHPGGAAAVRELAHRAARAVVVDRVSVPGEIVTIEVDYDGEDLTWCAHELHITAHELVAAHQRAHWQVAFIGFAPGFAYLTAPDWPYRLPRLPDPRPSVPAGAVAVADGFSAVYPGASPGGWRLIGCTSARLWEPAAEPPTPFRSGTAVRFIEAGR